MYLAHLFGGRSATFLGSPHGRRGELQELLVQLGSLCLQGGQAEDCFINRGANPCANSGDAGIIGTAQLDLVKGLFLFPLGLGIFTFNVRVLRLRDFENFRVLAQLVDRAVETRDKGL